MKTVGNSELLIIGQSAGKTTLLLWGTDNQRTTVTIDVSGSSGDERASSDDLVASNPTESKSVSLVPGGYTVVFFEADLVRVALGDPSIADIQLQGSRNVRIEGLEVGKTTVLAWFAGGGRATVTVEVKQSKNFDDRVPDMLMKASMARGRGDYAKAKGLLLQILRVDPQNEAARRMLGEMRDQSRDLYLRAYQLEDAAPEEAIKLFREVLLLTAPDDETHQKAKSRIAELSGH